MNKTIILVDRYSACAKHVLAHTTWNIAVLVVETEQEKEEFLNSPRVFEVYTVKEIINSDHIENIDYAMIDKFRSTQLNIENGTARLVADYQMGKYYFYTGLSFWAKIFETYKIDAVILKGYVHGGPYDCLPKDFAISKCIPCYTIESFAFSARCIYDNINASLVEVPLDYQRFDNKMSQNYSMPYHNDFYRVIKQTGWIRRIILSCAYKLGGSLLIDFIFCLKNRTFVLSDTLIDDSFFHKLYYYMRFKTIGKYLDSMSSDIDPNDKFVFYALHLEPEAGILGAAILDSQLTVIQMIAKSLPDGWKLYVKEHPHQFELNNCLMHDFIRNITYFKTKRFYNAISQIKNVKMVRRDISAQKLMQKAQAVATLNGTIGLEAIAYNKPALIFASEHTAFRYCKDYFLIHSFQDCQAALVKIEKGFVPQYSDFKEVFARYALEETDTGFKNAIKVIAELL